MLERRVPVLQHNIYKSYATGVWSHREPSSIPSILGFCASDFGKNTSSRWLRPPPTPKLETRVIPSWAPAWERALSPVSCTSRQRAQEKVDKYRAGYAAQDMRRAFLPAVVSTSGRIHGEFVRLMYILADNKTKLHFEALDQADVDSEAYCWRRSGVFWRMRASIGLACAQATTLSTQVFGKARPRSRAGRPRA